MRPLLRILLFNQALALLITCGLALLLGLRTLPYIWLPSFIITNGVGTSVGLLFILLDRSGIYHSAAPAWKNMARACAVVAGTALGMGVAFVALKLLHPRADFPIKEVLSLSGFALLISTSVAGVNILLAQLRAHIEQKAIEVQKLRELEAQTRLAALQSKVNPHFLFNTLNTMLNLVHRSPEDVETLILCLSDLYRRVLQLPENGLIPLSEEMELVRRYLEIEQIRLGSRLSFAMDVEPEAAAIQIPPLLVEPLVENAVKHGIGPRTEGGNVWIQAKLIDGFVHIVVEDDGAGIGSQNGSGGFGLYSIQERLRITYQGRASLKTKPQAGRGFRAELMVPHA